MNQQRKHFRLAEPSNTTPPSHLSPILVLAGIGVLLVFCVVSCDGSQGPEPRRRYSTYRPAQTYPAALQALTEAVRKMSFAPPKINI